MPVRIYDISKKLGLENKEVLSKAKELGIAAARVASSSLDKITAEYLEQQLILAYPGRTSVPPAESTPATQPVETVTTVTTVQIEAPPTKAPEVLTNAHSAVVVQEPLPEAPPPAPVAEITAPTIAPEPVSPAPVESFVKVLTPPTVPEEPSALTPVASPPPAESPWGGDEAQGAAKNRERKKQKVKIKCEKE